MSPVPQGTAELIAHIFRPSRRDGVKVAPYEVRGRNQKMSPVPQGTAGLIAHIFRPSRRDGVKVAPYEVRGRN